MRETTSVGIVQMCTTSDVEANLASAALGGGSCQALRAALPSPEGASL